MLTEVRAFVTSIYGAVILTLLAAFLIQTARIEGFKVWPIHIAGLKAQLKTEQDGRAADRRAYHDAQGQAAQLNKMEVERIKSEQEKVNADIKKRYDSDLARLRAGGLRPEYQAPPGSPGKPGAGTDGNAACRADAENVCVPRTVLVRAGEIELSRNSLIDWVNLQLGVKRS